jgi:NAD(P)-dependent dehydrogenase (short-subunit alcohol dehydrogenase family)
VTSVSDTATNSWPVHADSAPFAGLRVWVTGGSRGLGRIIASDLSRAGARLAVTARSDGAMDGIERECEGREVLRAPGSVAVEEDVQRIAAEIEARWGGLDAVVHCAGISPVFHLAGDLSADEWREIVDVNLTGTFLVAKAAAELMATGGSVVTMSSVHARSAGRRLAAYSAAKGGVESLTRALALDWAARGIRVNCVAPGYFETDMTEDLAKSPHQMDRLLAHIPLGALGRPDQIVDMVRLLVGPGSSYITGSVFSIDGGWTAA